MSLVTWNMQGAGFSNEDKWRIGVSNFITNGARIVCLQECGVYPPSAVEIWRSRRYPGLKILRWGTLRSAKYILFHPWDTLGRRVNTAIVTSYEISGANVIPPISIPRTHRLFPDSRPAIALRIGAMSYVSIHAISPRGPDVRILMDEIHNSIYLNGVVFVAGDFNRDPAMLPHWNLCPPLSATYSTRAARPTRRYDYCYSNFASVQGDVLNVIQSDHYPVEYDID